MVRFFMDTNQWLLPCVCQGTSADLLLKLRAIEQPSSPARAPGTRQRMLTYFLWVPVCNRKTAGTQARRFLSITFHNYYHICYAAGKT